MEAWARLDVKACGFWGNSMQCEFSDVRVFHPNAQSNLLSNLTAMYSKHEAEKKRVYGQCVREVEQASFTPLCFRVPVEWEERPQWFTNASHH